MKMNKIFNWQVLLCLCFFSTAMMAAQMNTPTNTAQMSSELPSMQLEKSTEAENTTLARISNILNAVYPLIAKAKAEAMPNTRIKFRYDWLQKDIQGIQAGIGQKINASQVEPRVVAPLQVQYLQQQNGHV